jgi:hypothetical protein
MRTVSALLAAIIRFARRRASRGMYVRQGRDFRKRLGEYFSFIQMMVVEHPLPPSRCHLTLNRRSGKAARAWCTLLKGGGPTTHPPGPARQWDALIGRGLIYRFKNWTISSQYCERSCDRCGHYQKHHFSVPPASQSVLAVVVTDLTVREKTKIEIVFSNVRYEQSVCRGGGSLPAG